MISSVNAFIRPLSSAVKIQKSSLSMLKVGDVAPDFELKNFLGKAFKLSSYRGKKPTVIFFYPSDNTPGCKAEVIIILSIIFVIEDC